MPKVLGFGVEMPRGTWLVVLQSPSREPDAADLLKVKSVDQLSAAREAAMGGRRAAKQMRPSLIGQPRVVY